ncbi:MAG: TIGR01210 family radical SAM protein [Euryarchaeota archaeon]|nr:TIGR01210 family radical SAM protein [Euryarchaeota archaeon]|tara:strand:- start:302 stop:1468 length:1167 start_codon:yes stop_codon:yes gene_type:complete
MAERRLVMHPQSDVKPKKIHDLIKAPANLPWALEKKQSWDANDLATVYHTPETLSDGTPTQAVTVILRTKGCHWWWSSGCTFCGYFNDTRDDVTAENLFSQWDKAKAKYHNFKDMGMVKVYTSGSLLEDREIPLEFQQRVLEDCHDLKKELVIESRTEQITEEKLEWATKHNPNFTVAIGLEAYDDGVLRFHVNKGFSKSSWDRAVELLQKYALRVKTYLMFKPPFMSEGDALLHGVNWVKAVAEKSDEISVNPMNIQKGTIIDRLYRSDQFRPPWLWSLVSMIEQTHAFIHPKNGVNGDEDQVSRLIIHPTAGGKPRGAHNCGDCDSDVVAAIERYSVSGDLIDLEGLSCQCKEVWQEEISLDGSLPNPLGVGLRRRGLSRLNLRKT